MVEVRGSFAQLLDAQPHPSHLSRWIPSFTVARYLQLFASELLLYLVPPSGLFQCSGCFITSEERSLAFWLSEHGGYQVFLGNLV
jgi:hypothetical protein